MVTGASGGIARALVARLPADARVALVTRDASKLAGAAHTVIEADCSTPEGVHYAFEQCEARLGVAQSLAHLAGSTLIAPLHRTTAVQFSEVMRANLASSFFTLGQFVTRLREADLPGAAVLSSSVVARMGTSNHEAIAAAKAGVEGLVISSAATYAAAKIRVNAVAPGMTDTPMAAGILRSDAMREAAAKQYPLGGISSADDVAGVIAFLLSEDAARITGQIFPVDGGYSAIRPLVR